MKRFFSVMAVAALVATPLTAQPTDAQGPRSAQVPDFLNLGPTHGVIPAIPTYEERPRLPPAAERVEQAAERVEQARAACLGILEHGEEKATTADMRVCIAGFLAGAGGPR
jgi:hypothetical protein